MKESVWLEYSWAQIIATLTAIVRILPNLRNTWNSLRRSNDWSGLVLTSDVMNGVAVDRKARTESEKTHTQDSSSPTSWGANFGKLNFRTQLKTQGRPKRTFCKNNASKGAEGGRCGRKRKIRTRPKTAIERKHCKETDHAALNTVSKVLPLPLCKCRARVQINYGLLLGIYVYLHTNNILAVDTVFTNNAILFQIICKLFWWLTVCISCKLISTIIVVTEIFQQ